MGLKYDFNQYQLIFGSKYDFNHKNKITRKKYLLLDCERLSQTYDYEQHGFTVKIWAKFGGSLNVNSSHSTTSHILHLLCWLSENLNYIGDTW